MLGVFLQNAEQFLVAAIILLLLIACSILFYFNWKKENEEDEIQEANLEASKKVALVAENIINRKRGDGISKLRKLQQDKRD
jgi:hypothetical protein